MLLLLELLEDVWREVAHGLAGAKAEVLLEGGWSAGEVCLLLVVLVEDTEYLLLELVVVIALGRLVERVVVFDEALAVLDLDGVEHVHLAL